MVKNKINSTSLIFVLIILGLILYINFCQEKDYLTKKEGKELSEKSEQSLKMMDSLFEALKGIDSSKIINNYYTNKYETIKKQTDKILTGDPLLVDSVFLYWTRKLRSGRSPIK